MTLHIETPALLFSATSLILLAYTNRFLTIATIIRSLKKVYKEKENRLVLLEIKNLNLRLTLIRYMQMAGVLSLFLSVFGKIPFCARRTVFKRYSPCNQGESGLMASALFIYSCTSL